MEVVVTLFLLSLLISLATRCLLTIWMNAVPFTAFAENHSVWRNISRTLTHDVHSASASDANGHVLRLTLVDGTRYRYYVNARAQLIRERSGGGTSVIGVGVLGFLSQQEGQTILLMVDLEGIGSETLTVSTLRALTS